MADKDKLVHDRLFKRTFGKLRHAEGVFRTLLPAELVARADWSTLALEEGTYVDPQLQLRHSDLLFSVAVGGRPTLLYLLFEHQSTVDHLMSFRMLRYVVRIWERWIDQNQGARTLPAVVPMVLYHGHKPWSAATELADIIDIDAGVCASVRDHLPRLRFVLDDLARASEEEIRARRLASTVARVAQAMLKVLRGNAAIESLRNWSPLLAQIEKEPGGLQDLDTLVYYILAVCGQEQREEVVRIMQEHLDNEGRDVIVTIADSYRAEGRVEGAVRAVLAVFEARDMAVPDDVRRRIEVCEDPEELAGWLRRAVSAALPAEIFGE